MSIEKRWVEDQILETEENNNYKFDEWRSKKVQKRQEKLRLIKQKIFNVWTLKFVVFLFIGHCIGDFYQAVQKSRFNAAVVSQCKSTRRKKLFIGVMTTPDYLLTRGAAIRGNFVFQTIFVNLKIIRNVAERNRRERSDGSVLLSAGGRL